MMKLLLVLIPAAVAFFTYWLGDKRKIANLEKEIDDKLKELRDAVAQSDSLRISILERDIKQLRSSLDRITAK